MREVWGERWTPSSRAGDVCRKPSKRASLQHGREYIKNTFLIANVLGGALCSYCSVVADSPRPYILTIIVDKK